MVVVLIKRIVTMSQFSQKLKNKIFCEDCDHDCSSRTAIIVVVLIKTQI